MALSPQFGAKPSKEDFARFKQSAQFDGKIFLNQMPTQLGASFGSMMDTLWQYIKGNPKRNATADEVPVISVKPAELTQEQSEDRLMWFGHSSFLLQSAGKNFLFDPMFSDVPAPHPWLGTKRYSGKLPIAPEALPAINAVFISHDHYDHLDYLSIATLANKTEQFYVPLGVGAHLKRWGISAEKITEMDWWQQTQIDDVEVAFTPARHFSGRGLTGQNTSLWGSWLIKSPSLSLYFSGDTGYGEHFKEIYQRYGAVDFALLECGQYHQNWADIHMMPEQTAQAAKDLNAKVMMPVHWGAFTLSLHDWNEPAVRVNEAAAKLGQAIVIPQIGELVSLHKPNFFDSNPWWARERVKASRIDFVQSRRFLIAAFEMPLSHSKQISDNKEQGASG